MPKYSGVVKVRVCGEGAGEINKWSDTSSERNMISSVIGPAT